MKLYKIIYCYLDKNGIIETDSRGEVIYTFLASAVSKEEAVGIMFTKEKFVSMPEILAVVEEQEIWKY